jgi:hypothetical protein
MRKREAARRFDHGTHRALFRGSLVPLVTFVHPVPARLGKGCNDQSSA